MDYKECTKKHWATLGNCWNFFCRFFGLQFNGNIQPFPRLPKGKSFCKANISVESFCAHKMASNTKKAFKKNQKI